MWRSNRSASRTRRRGNSPDASLRTIPPPPGDVASSTLANMDLSMTRAAMLEYARRCESLSAENEQLRAQLRDEAADAVKVVQHLETRLEATESAAAEQQREIGRLLSSAADESAALRQEYDHIVEQRDEQVAQYTALAGRLQTELKSAAQHVRQREEHRLELQRLHNSLEELAARHETELTAMRFQTVDRKMRLVALEQTMRDSFRAQVEAESARLLDVKSRALLEDHDELQRERVRLTQDIDGLVQLTTTMNAERAEVRRKGVLHQHACREALRRIVHGNRRARESEMKTQRLEQRLKEFQEERRTLRETLSREYETQLKERDATIDDLRDSLRMHRTELTRLRRVASTVVSQRSDLERFFYVALNDVRRMRSESKSFSFNSTAHTMGTDRRHMNSERGTGRVAKKRATPSPAPIPQRPQDPPTQLQNFLKRPSSLSTNPLQLPLLGTLSDTAANSSQQSHILPHPPPRDSSNNLTFMTQPMTLASAPVPSAVGNQLRVDLGKGGGAYLEDLSWEDKEKIIKALLFFINRSCYEKLPGELPPAQSEEVDDEEAIRQLGEEVSCKLDPGAVIPLKCKESKV